MPCTHTQVRVSNEDELARWIGVGDSLELNAAGNASAGVFKNAALSRGYRESLGFLACVVSRLPAPAATVPVRYRGRGVSDTEMGMCTGLPPRQDS